MSLIRHRFGRLPRWSGVPVAMIACWPACANAAPAPAEAPRDIGVVTATGVGDPATDARPSPAGTRDQSKASKRLAPNLIEVQPQDEIRKLPDISVADAISRVPGISLETDTAEGRFVNIRGLEANLDAVMFGGVKLVPSQPSSPFGGGRAIALDTFPASLIGGFVLTKSLRPDQDAEGLGGQIDILPRAVVNDGRTHVDATILGGVEPLRGSPVVGGDITVTSNFGYAPGTRPWERRGAGGTAGDVPSGDFFTNPRPFSVVFTESHFNDQRGIDDFEPSYSDTPGTPTRLYSGLDLRRYDYQRRRFGRGGEVDFKPNDQNSWFIRYIESGYNDHSSRHRLALGGLDSALPCAPQPGCTAAPGGAGFLAPQATAVQDLRNLEEELQTRIITFGGANLIAGRVKLDYRGAFVEGAYSKPYDYISSFTNPNPFPLAYDNTTDAQHPGYRPLEGTHLPDPANYVLRGINASQQKVRDREWSGVANVAVPLDIGLFSGVAKVGGSVRLRERTVAAPQQSYGATGITPYAPFSFGPDEVYYDGAYNIGPTPSPNVIGLIGTPALSRNRLVRDATRTAGASEDDRENVYAWYGQYEATYGRLNLLGGLRFEQTGGHYGANTVVTTGDTYTVTPSVTRQSYLDVFPTLQLRYAVEPSLIARAAYSTAIARPGFTQITPSTLVDVGAGIVTTGNPTLKPTTGDAFDISIERYLPHGGIASIGAFGKIFQHYIIPTGTFGSYPGIDGVAQINGFSDGGGAHAYGVEVAYTQQFDFLPGWLSGFGVDANYTYVQSGVRLHPGGGDEPLPATADHNFNAALFYEKGPATIRLAGAYVSKSLFIVGPSRDLDVFGTPRFRLDLGARYRLNEHLELFTEARNLTDAALEYVEGASSTRYVQREFYGVTLYSGARVTF